MLEAVQGRIERTLVDAQHVVGNLLNPLGNRPAVHRTILEGPEDQKIERALEKIDAGYSRHDVERLQQYHPWCRMSTTRIVSARDGCSGSARQLAVAVGSRCIQPTRSKRRIKAAATADKPSARAAATVAGLYEIHLDEQDGRDCPAERASLAIPTISTARLAPASRPKCLPIGSSFPRTIW